ncbi:hypothetical protein WN944_026320 [Citrus x changshan-huyou]|uniref:Uncharacterized protein n=1 Tax=Citrus x changshan-huyou TaxID=2935761 RepID=A0AAP0QD57_9ROSI
MNSVSIEIEEALLLDNNGEISQSQIDPNLFKATAAGNSKPFKDVAREKTENMPTKFVGEILEICPSLLLQVNAKGDSRSLLVAVKFGHCDIVSVLIERAKLVQHEDEELESGVGASRQMIRMTNEEKHTALHGAVFHKNVDVVKILTREDPDYPCSANNYSKTLLCMAAEYEHSSQMFSSVVGEEMIREHHVRINRRLPHMFVSRKKDWSWEMSNILYCYSSVPDARRVGGTGPLLVCV